MNPFEGENLRAYILLLRIEIVLRECLKSALEKQFGLQWQKKLPGDLLSKIKKSQLDENKPQFNFIRLGPLYYLTFGELLTILQQKAGNTVTETFGGGIFLKQLENLFSPRNAICHSRPVSSIGLKTIETLYAQMETAITKEAISDFLSNPDTGLSQKEASLALKLPLEQILRDLPSLPSVLLIPESYHMVVHQFWWASDSLAGFERAHVENAVDLVREYNALPIGVGSAAKRQNLSEDRDMKKQVRFAIIELEKVLL